MIMSSPQPALSISVDDVSGTALEFDDLRSDTVDLSAVALDWAAQIVQTVDEATDPWPGYLRALALQGFRQWVEAGAAAQTVSYDVTRVPPLGMNCEVGGFRLCLIPQGGGREDVVGLPVSTVDDVHNFAHVYVLVEVQEEADRVTIWNGLRRDLLLAQAAQLTQRDEAYWVPTSAFETSPAELLLFLTCLAPEQLATTAPKPAPVSPPSTARPSVGQSVINAGYWLRDQLDTVADQLAWSLLPPMHTAIALRSPAEEITDILADMPPTVTVPTHARGAYTECHALGLPLRLYALAWTLFETEVPEWSLLLCLSLGDRGQLPPGLRLTICEGGGPSLDPAPAVLVQETLAPGAESTCLYGQVIGTWNERFIVTVELPNGPVLTWPSFGFQPD